MIKSACVHLHESEGYDVVMKLVITLENSKGSKNIKCDVTRLKSIKPNFEACQSLGVMVINYACAE